MGTHTKPSRTAGTIPKLKHQTLLGQLWQQFSGFLRLTDGLFLPQRLNDICAPHFAIAATCFSNNWLSGSHFETMPLKGAQKV
jgi:hypothetical protein